MSDGGAIVRVRIDVRPPVTLAWVLGIGAGASARVELAMHMQGYVTSRHEALVVYGRVTAGVLLNRRCAA